MSIGDTVGVEITYDCARVRARCRTLTKTRASSPGHVPRNSKEKKKKKKTNLNGGEQHQRCGGLVNPPTYSASDCRDLLWLAVRSVATSLESRRRSGQKRGRFRFDCEGNVLLYSTVRGFTGLQCCCRVTRLSYPHVLAWCSGLKLAKWI